jgi:hypothetical protein
MRHIFANQPPSPRTQVHRLLPTFFGLLLTASPALAFDVAVGEIHVTQAVQNYDPHFAVPLVADRSTAVRVQVLRVNGVPGVVTGKLRVFVDGVEITPAGGINDLNQTFPNPFIPPASQNNRFYDLLFNEDETLNFELPASQFPITPSANQLESQDVDFVVEIFAPGDINPANDVGRLDNVVVKRRAAPRIFTDRLFYVANLNLPPGSIPPYPVPAANRPDDTFIAPGRGDAMVAAVWPIADANPSQVFPLLLNGLYLAWDCNFDAAGNPLGPGDGKITLDQKCFDSQRVFQGTEQGLLLAKLARRRQLLVNNGLGPDARTFLYAWVKDGFLHDHDGLTQGKGGKVGYGVDRPSEGQMVFAHEFGHMLGYDHNNPGRVVHDFGWDVGARLQNNPLVMSGLTGRVKGAGNFDELMNTSGTLTTTNTWIDFAHYKDAAVDNPILAAETGPSSCREASARETVVVTGGLTGDKYGLRIGAAVFRYPWCTPDYAVVATPNVRVTLKVRRPGSSVIDAFTAAIDARTLIDGRAGESTEIGPFTVPFVVVKGSRIISVRVEPIGDDTIRATELVPSVNPPTVSIVSHKPGATIGPETTIAWAGVDKDAGARLSYQVAYSPNDGKDFVPIEVDLAQTKITIETLGLPRTETGRGLIRVFVNDGVNTSYADVGGLTLLTP